MNLSEQERDKFALWLEEEANSIDQTAEQMKKLKLPEVVFKKFKTESVACLIVAAKLKSIDTQTF